MEKGTKQHEYTEITDVSWRLLDEVQICPFTGRKYNAVRKVKCTCPCHDPNETMIHFMPCCDNGYVEEYKYID